MQNCSLPLGLYGASANGNTPGLGRRTRRKNKQKPRIPRIDTPVPQKSTFRKVSYIGSVSTTAAGIISQTSVSSNSAFLSGSEFSSLANLYGEYRVHAISIKGIPNQTTSTGSPLGYQTGMMFCRYESGYQPTSTNNILSAESMKVFSTLEPFQYQVKLDKFLDGKLWTATNAQIPTANQYGISFVGINNATMVISSRVYDLLIEFMVEFRIQL
jgi:hypothetical protein